MWQTVVLLTGFAASAVAEWVLLTILEFRSGLPVILIAAIHMSLVIGVNAACMHAAATVLRRDAGSITDRSKPTAAWIAPLVVYVVADSVWAVPFAAFVAFLIVASIRSSRVGSETSSAQSNRENSQMFHLLSPRSTSSLVWFFCCGICVEATAVTTAGHAVRPAILLAAMAAAITAGHVDNTYGTHSKHRLRQSTSALLTLVLALALTAGGLRGNNVDSAGSITDSHGSAYRGIFLRPEGSQNAIQLVAPPRWLGDAHKYGPHIPIRIPFNGVYWLFRHPDMRPPDDAVTAHGDPEQLRFRSTDATPLIMEAHQHFESPIDLSCCGRVEVEIGVADDDTTDVLLEVILTDSSTGDATQLSLGVAPVRPASHEQLLTFVVPESLSIINFDGLTIRYHFNSQKDTESTRIGIRYLVLMPR